jgi:hypothetical protein
MPNIDDIQTLIFNVDAATTLVKKNSERIHFFGENSNKIVFDAE